MTYLLNIDIPNSGNTYIQKALHIHRPEQKIINEEVLIEEFKENRHITFGHTDIYKIVHDNKLSNSFYNNSYKFTIIRNPYDRAVSLYHDLNKIVNFSINYPTFSSWADYLYKHKNTIPKNNSEDTIINKYGITNKWNPQYTWIPSTINTIYYFENLEQSFHDIIQKTNVDHIPLSIQDTSSISNHYSTYYNETAQQQILSIYNKDFELFNYSKELPDKCENTFGPYGPYVCHVPFLLTSKEYINRPTKKTKSKNNIKKPNNIEYNHPNFSNKLVAAVNNFKLA